MKRIWRMAGVGLLVVSVSAQVTADERDNSPGQGQSQGQRPQGGGGQHERGPEGGG
ncbi:glycine zipper family protein, partial [Pseudomonas sp. TNT11]|nr:glycine zipper family protein [Pseudomonas emilianonis]